jgi:hypothetical protein
MGLKALGRAIIVEWAVVVLVAPGVERLLAQLERCRNRLSPVQAMGVSAAALPEH